MCRPFQIACGMVLSAALLCLMRDMLPAAPRARGESATIRLERVPDGGIQPQLAVGTDGTVHLVYFKGEPGAGDLHYCRRGANETRFSEAIRVNSVPGSAIATGTIRGAQIALGADDRLHVAWNGSKQARPRGPRDQTPLLYTRTTEDGMSFEPERNLITSAYGLDGGACIAAGPTGHVYVAWHAGTEPDEGLRRVWLVRSSDNGKSFDSERAIDPDEVGACGCCGMRGTVSPSGDLMLLYRAAREKVHRDMYLLASGDAGGTFESRRLHDWQLRACPMSSEAFAHGLDRSWAAWETAEQVYVAAVEDAQVDGVTPRSAPGTSPAGRKHPALAVNGEGQVLFVWTEGTGWNRGGNLAWRLLATDGDPTVEHGMAEGVPVWSFAAAYARPDGTFVVLY